MKKLFLLIGIAFLFSCASTGNVGTVHDPSVPATQTAQLSPSGIGRITGYNGAAVNWPAGWTKLVQIPAGNTTLEWYISTPEIMNNNNDKDNSPFVAVTHTTYSFRDALIAYNFRPQKKYFFIPAFQDEKYGLNVYSYNFDETIKIKWEDVKPHFEAFTPFLNVRGVNERVILE